MASEGDAPLSQALASADRAPGDVDAGGTRPCSEPQSVLRNPAGRAAAKNPGATLGASPSGAHAGVSLESARGRATVAPACATVARPRARPDFLALPLARCAIMPTQLAYARCAVWA